MYSCVSPRIFPAPQNVPACPLQAKLPASQVSTISDPFSSSRLKYILSAASMSCHFSFQGLSGSYGKSPKIWTLILAPSLHLSGPLFLCQINCCFACRSDLFSTLPLLCSVHYWELHFPECLPVGSANRKTGGWRTIWWEEGRSQAVSMLLCFLTRRAAGCVASFHPSTIPSSARQPPLFSFCQIALEASGSVRLLCKFAFPALEM